MRLRYLIFIVLAFAILFSGCSSKDVKEVMSENLIAGNLDGIDMIQIGFALEASKQTTDKELISKIYKNISGTKMEKLSVDKENALMQSNELSYSMLFTSEQNVVGSVLIFSSGDIIMHDITTMQGNQRTVAYIHNNLDEERLQNLISVFDKLN